MSRRRRRDAAGHHLAGFLGPPLVRGLGATCRVTAEGEENLAVARARGPVLFALWHGRLLPVAITHRDRGLVALVSAHRDGEYIGRILERVGFRIVRGSTTRGGARALFEMAAHAGQGRDLAITPDGPRGPHRDVRAGVLAIAQRAGIAIVPLGAAASRAWVLPTWDGFVVPRPGSRMAIVYGPPLYVAPEDDADAAALRSLLAERIEDATRAADRLAASDRGRREATADDAWRPAAEARSSRPTASKRTPTEARHIPRGALGISWNVSGPTASLSEHDRTSAPSSSAALRAHRGAPMLFAYRAVTDLLYALFWPGLWLLARARPDRWASRMGRVDGVPRGGIWLHAASVGELAGAAPLLSALAARLPDDLILVSTMTCTGQRLAREGGFPVAGSFLVPFDFRSAVARCLEAVAPRALVLLETELWPNMLVEASRRGVPVAIVNARISDRTARRYRRLRPLFERGLASVAWIGAQTERDRERFLAIGASASAVEVVGTSKEDARATAGERDAVRHALRLAPEEPLLVFGSARAAEDEVFLPVVSMLVARHPGLRVLYAPRHVERVGALMARIAAAGITARTLSAWRRDGGDARVLVLDSIGELAGLYAAADAAVIGGSFSHHGGHNPLEAARCGVPVVMGPRRENVRDVFDRLEAAGGAEAVADGEGLARAVTLLIEEEAERTRRGDAARAAVEARDSVTERILDALARHGVLPEAGPPPAGGR